MIDSYLLSLIFWIWRSCRAILCVHRSSEKNYKTPALGKTLDNGLKVIYLCTANSQDIVDPNHQSKKSSGHCNLIAKELLTNKISVLSLPSGSIPQANLTPAVSVNPSIMIERVSYRVKEHHQGHYGVVMDKIRKDTSMSLWTARIDTAVVVHQ